MNNFTFISDFAHTPSFFIIQPHVGALISKVRKEQPAMLNRHIIRVFTGTASFDANIRVNAIPIAPLKPPYVKANTYDHFKPYPEFFNLGMNTEIEKNLANVIQTYNNNNLVI